MTLGLARKVEEEWAGMESRERDGEELWGLGGSAGSAAGRGWYSLGRISPASDGAEDAGWRLSGSQRQFPCRRQGKPGLT